MKVVDPHDQMLEKDLLAGVRQMGDTFGWLMYHTHTSIHSVKGFPDLTAIRKGRVLFAELKSSKGKLTPEQTKWLDDIASGEVEAYLWTPRDWASGEIERVLQFGPSDNDISRWVAP